MNLHIEVKIKGWCIGSLDHPYSFYQLKEKKRNAIWSHEYKVKAPECIISCSLQCECEQVLFSEMLVKGAQKNNSHLTIVGSITAGIIRVTSR